MKNEDGWSEKNNQVKCKREKACGVQTPSQSSILSPTFVLFSSFFFIFLLFLFFLLLYRFVNQNYKEIYREVVFSLWRIPEQAEKFLFIPSTLRVRLHDYLQTSNKSHNQMDSPSKLCNHRISIFMKQLDEIR